MVSFKCGVHLIDSKEFEVNDYEQWQLHIANFDHEHAGFNACKDCGAPNIPHRVTLKLQPRQVPPTYCESCLNRLKELISEGKLHE